jgi:osmotically-inducible protein OsmY
MAARKTFLLGQAMIFADGVVGRLVGLEMEPDWTPIHLLVQAPGRWPWQVGPTVRLPVQAATEFRDEEILLDIPSTKGQVIPHPGAPHAEGEVTWLDTFSRLQIAPRAVERQAGRFLGLVVEPDGSVRLIGEVGTMAKRRILVPGESAAYQNHDFVWLDLKGKSLDIFPTYEPDSYVEREAWAALRSVSGLGETELRAVRLEVEEGKVLLSGNVASSRIAEAMEGTLSGVSCVLGVESRLVADPDVETSVASALAQNPSTQGERFIVHSRLGRVSLEGQVKPEAAQAAVGVAQEVAGVVSVESRLQPLGPGKARRTA